MKITVLGSGGFGYPLVFCDCQYCKQAKILKGKSRYYRSQETKDNINHTVCRSLACIQIQRKPIMKNIFWDN